MRGFKNYFVCSLLIFTEEGCYSFVTFLRHAINVGKEEERAVACVLLQFGLLQIVHIRCVAHPSLNISVQ